MELLGAFALSGLINGFIALGLGVFIISHNWRDKVNRLYFLIILATSLWSFSYWRWLSSIDVESALFWVRLLSIGSTLIPIFYFHWVVSMLNADKKEKTTVWLVYILGTIFLMFSFSDLFISGVQQKLFFPFWPNPGIIYHFYFFTLYACLVIYSVKLLLESYKSSVGEERKRIIYILGGTVVAFGGGLSNFFLWYNIPIAPYTNFLVAFFPFLFGYATIRYRLFKVQVVATELFTIAIWVFLFVRVLISDGFNDLLPNIILFVTVVFFGILLIRSVFKEVRQRERIEKIEKELEVAYKLEKKAKEDTDRAYALEKKANEELKRIDAYKNEFLRQAQHDLRSPLSIIMGYAELLLNGDFGKIPKKGIDVIKRIQVVTQNKIKDVNNFLNTEQFRMGKGVVSLKSGIKILPMLEEIVNGLKYKAESKGIYIKLEKPTENIVVAADKEKLKSALFNIVDNSVKYTNKGGIKIRLEENKSVKIEIKDTGIGIPKEKIKTLFETQFERADQAEKVATGSGVGLYLSNKIIKLHNGKVWAQSDGEGKGSTFTVELPIGQ